MIEIKRLYQFDIDPNLRPEDAHTPSAVELRERGCVQRSEVMTLAFFDEVRAEIQKAELTGHSDYFWIVPESFMHWHGRWADRGSNRTFSIGRKAISRRRKRKMRMAYRR